MAYPTRARVNGVDYPIDTDYKTALRCLKVSRDDTIGDTERALAIIYLLFEFVPPIEQAGAFFDKAVKFLQCGDKDNVARDNNTPVDFDHSADEAYINASFMSDYHIDLTKGEPLHWWYYCDLISGLTETSILSRVRSLRNIDVAEYKDEKIKREIIKAKESVALDLRTEKEKQEERDAIEDFKRQMGW